MDTPQKQPLLDRAFATPPWKSPGFIVCATMISILTVYHCVIDPSTPPSESITPTEVLRIVKAFGQALGGAILYFLPSYLVFLGLERLTKLAHLTESQFKMTHILSILIALSVSIVLFALVRRI
jgi:hypothetical protein